MIFMVKENLYQKHFCGEIGFKKKKIFEKMFMAFFKESLGSKKNLMIFKKRKISFTNFAHSKDYVFLKEILAW